MFRTADAAGVEKLYLCGITPEPADRLGKIRPQVAKVALGAEKTVAWEKIRSTAAVVKKLKRAGYEIWAVEQAPGSRPYYKTDRTNKSDKLNMVALVFGNEIKGLSPAILKLADKILEIPMRGKKESLNVSVAFGIVVFGLLYK